MRRRVGIVKILRSGSARYLPDLDVWEGVAGLPEDLSELAAVARDGFLYVLGGESAEPAEVATVLRYSPAEDSWTEVDSMPTERRLHAAALL